MSERQRPLRSASSLALTRDADSEAIRPILMRFGSTRSRADDTNSRLEKLEIRAYDTNPIWEQALKEIVETRREISKRLDRIDAMALETRADLRDAEDRLEKLERKPSQ